MLRVNRTTGTLVPLSRTTLSDAGIGERSGLQELILKNSEAFFEECQETLFLVKEEVEPSSQVSSRIDLLAIDVKGHAVIVELKRGSDKMQLLQSLTYAAMLADWPEERFRKHIPTAHMGAFEQFRHDHDITKLNEFQRIILIAESFDFEILRTAEWLTDSYGLNITCYQISLAQENDEGMEYLAALQLFPPRALASQARRRGALKSEEASKFTEIEELLQSCTNKAIVRFYTDRLGERRNKRRDSLVFPHLGQMRFRIRPKKEYARVNQLGRFDGDADHWQKTMSAPLLRAHPTYLRFRLTTDSDIEAFLKFTSEALAAVSWTKSSASDEETDSEEE
jgi:hypothetical protein